MTPAVLSEMETVQRLAAGRLNMSRLGFCECKLIYGRSGLAQAPDPVLAKRLRKLLRSTDERTLVCIPRVFDEMPSGKAKWYEWITKPDVMGELFRPWGTYGSTFVSRRDGFSPGMDENAYWRLVRSQWQDRPVLLLAGSGKGLRAQDEFLANAASVDVLQAPERDAWASYEAIRADCLAWAGVKRDPFVYAALGATAAILCAEMAKHGVQAQDWGHAAQSWNRSDLKSGEFKKAAA